MKHFTLLHNIFYNRITLKKFCSGSFLFRGAGNTFKTFSLLLLVFIASTTLQAQAPIELNISSGNITIPGTSTSDYIISGTTTSNRITIQSGYHGNVTLKNLKIEYTGNPSASCITVEGRTITGTTVTEESKNSNLNPVTKVDFILEGTNELLLMSGATSSSVYCALQVDRGAQIHIRATDPNDNDSGILIAKSTSKIPGVTTTNRDGGAGIGSRNYSSSSTNTNQGKIEVFTKNTNGTITKHSERYASGGNIIISSGTITTWGGHGAGIGGGWYTYYDGSIIVYGGIVKARAAVHSAGIGSGCPNGGGVIVANYADNSMIIVLPPASIEAYGANQTFAVKPEEDAKSVEWALSGMQVITYMNDPNKPEITVRTDDYEKNADIYLDLSETIVKDTTTLEDIFERLDIDYDLNKVRIGRTDALTGLFEFNGQFDQATTFFTDASSSSPTSFGRPYMPVRKTVTAAETIVLPLLETKISFTDYPSTPLEVGYTTTQARQNAFMTKMEYNDPFDMTDVTYQIQGGADPFNQIIFLDSDGTTVLSTPPSTLTDGDVYYMVLPIIQGKPIGIYSDILLIDGKWKGDPLPGYIRRVGMQRVVKNDTGTNEYIKVTASPNQFVEVSSTSQTVALTLNIDHKDTGVLYDPLDVTAKYLITTKADYEQALLETPLSSWQTLTVPASNGQNQVTIVPFNTIPNGTYYIHWYVESGVVYAHSQNVATPPHQYGGFGPYIITDPVVAGNLHGNPFVCSGETPAEIKGEASTGGSGDFSYQWQISTNNSTWTNIGGNTQNYTPAVLTVSPTYYRRITTDNQHGGTYQSNVFTISIVNDGLNLYWKQSATTSNWNDPDNWVDASGTALNMVPVACSNVFIPGGANIYPSLNPNDTPVEVYGSPVCRNITFAYGAELIYQHVLTYEKAHVQYNWGYYDDFSGVNHGQQPSNSIASSTSPVKERDRWYALAAPLKSMATGDFAFAGYPLSWQGGFSLSHPSTGASGGEIEVGDFSANFATNDKPLSETNNAIAVRVALYENSTGRDNHYNLEGLKGIVEIPYFENNEKSAYYPGHYYDRLAKESKFYYFNPQTLQLLHSPIGKMKRSDEAYRFIYEDENNMVPTIAVTGIPSTVPGYKQKVKRQNSSSLKVMIGNPFMASIDAKSFYNVNSNSILESDGYQLFNSVTQTWSQNTFASSGIISPLQAFIVTLKSDEVDLLFPLEGDNALAGKSSTKSISPDSNKSMLFMKATGKNGLEGDYSVLVSSVTDDITSNVKKMIYSEGHTTTETFFISPDTKGYNLIQLYEEGISEIGIAVKSSDTQNSQSLVFENVDVFFVTNSLYPVLIDKYLGVKQNLTLNNKYAFTQRQVESVSQYIDKDRFVLQLLSSDDVLAQGVDISIMYNDGQLEVRSIRHIKDVHIYDMLGRRVHSASNLNTGYYSKYLTLNKGVFVVKVYTENGETKVDKIIVP